MTIWQNIQLIPFSMIDIWKNFLFGPDRKGRSKVGLFGLVVVALLLVVYTYLGSRNMGIVLNVFVTFFVVFTWGFGLPAAIYLIDLKNKYGSLQAKK